MFPIVATRQVARGIKLFEIKAPRIAKKQRPGQFVIVRLNDTGERIPLTLADANPEAGTITIVVQAIGKTTRLLNMLEAGDSILDVVGPLGKPSEIDNFGTAVVVSGSVGSAMAYPTARELKRAGNKVISIVGARSKDLLVLEDDVRQVSDETYVLTDDGTAGEKGLVTKKLQELVEADKVDYVLACGPVPMMRAVANMTAPKKIKTVVSLNSIMVDGTGMCGGCRVLVNSRSQFACVDGPEFDASQVNFDVLTQRNNMYREQEKKSIELFQANLEAELAKLRESNRRHACALEVTLGEVAQ
ncbi:MAG TPA: sulfide/dihydroorotate dehydrogenase-like FAD/NAD-binding protein [Candidatus Binatia bacterium]|nr:sulfide/dihydroorotate dehydrogenase-like FAD/NAD-binding protein [Candidatus Binatia bacterium]